jgi:transcriptional regulator with XRE-family HTH domain
VLIARGRRWGYSGEGRRTRRLASLSQADVAREVGVSTAAVSRWEAGLRRPNGRHAVRYANLLRALDEDLPFKGESSAPDGPSHSGAFSAEPSAGSDPGPADDDA